MPASPSQNIHRNSFPRAQAPPRAFHEAEVDSAKTGRKKVKNAAQKETLTAKELDSNEASERGESPRPPPIADYDDPATKPLPTRIDFGPSPVLDALGTVGRGSDPNVSGFASAWAQQIPYGKTPPVDLLEGFQYDNSPPALSKPTTERGGFSTKTPPSSPPMRKARPTSFSAGNFSPPISTPRRVPSQGFAASSPPPPHLPQAHFYGAPEVDLASGARFKDPYHDDEGPQFVGFTRIPSASSKRPKSGNEAILLAQDDRIDVIVLERDKLNTIGSLEDIRGAVVEAEFLTWNSGPDPFHDLRPLMAVVVHGPKPPDQPSPAANDSVSDLDKNARYAGIKAAPHTRNVESTEYQTTVKVYSLAAQRSIVTLLWCKPSFGLPNIRGLPASVPSPSGSLKVDTCGNFIMISSGISGEIWIFGVDDQPEASFCCLGKFWTSTQQLQDRRYSNSSNSTDPDASPADLNRGFRPRQAPIASLSSRWLAIVPPEPIVTQSLSMTVLRKTGSIIASDYGSRNAPPQPSVSCTVESPDVESLLNRVARGVAQEMVRGARWLGGQSVQVWNTYVAKEQSSSTQPQSRNVYQGDGQLPLGTFPPTHASEARLISPEPQLVSIIDLYALTDGPKANDPEGLAPVATFQPPGGISFLSFSPDGLNILTATNKGDIQYVWDLKQIKHVRASSRLSSPDSNTLPYPGKVMQVARFTRVTPSSIIDVDWKSPSGDRFSVITKNGTVHVFDMPVSAFQWPPIRRTPRPEPSSAPASPAVIAQPDDSTVVSSVFSSAMRLAGRTQPILANLRGRTSSIGVSSPAGGVQTGIGLASATGLRGSKAVAAGLSKSVGAASGTVRSMRHSGDNRLHVSSLAKDPARSRVVWSHAGEQPALLVLDDQLLRSFPVSRRRTAAKSGGPLHSIINPNPKLSLRITASGQLPSGGRPRSVVQHGSGEESGGGYWLPRPLSNVQTLRTVHPLSYAEIETNAPYQPFHSDRRVALSLYTEESSPGGPSDRRKPWAFGENIGAHKLHLCSPMNTDEEDSSAGASVLYRQASTTNRDPLMSEAGMAEEIVVTTRRRKPRNTLPSALNTDAKAANDDGFFEDDCDVLDFAEDRV